MSAHAARVGAVIRKELTEFRRNRLIVGTAAMLPVVFLIAPTASILTVKASALTTGLAKGIDRSLFLPLIVPVLVPAIMSAYAVVGEREQGTLEPVLTTPVGRAELLIGKAAAIFIPAAALGYLIFGVFFAITQLAANSAVAAAVRHAPQLPATLVFIPLLAAWGVWVGLAVSTIVTDTRVAQQLSTLGSLPAVAVTALMSFQVISPTSAWPLPWPAACWRSTAPPVWWWSGCSTASASLPGLGPAAVSPHRPRRKTSSPRTK